MKTKLAVLMLLAGSSMFAETHFSIGIGLGGYGYAAPPVVAYAQPACPGPGYSWVDGYWDQAGPRRFWRDGYWAAPVYSTPVYSGGYRAVYGFNRDRYEGRYDRRAYGYGYAGDRSRFNENRGENRFRDNRESYQYNNGFVRH